MEDADIQFQPMLADVSNALVRLHKTQFGRGPTRARSAFAGPNVLVVVLEDALLPAEVKLVELGEQARVRESRGAFQAATATEFIEAIESIVDRKVQAFASAVDPDTCVVFENFYFHPADTGSDGASPSA